MVISWNTGLAAERARYNLKLKNKKRPAAQAASSKHQAPSLTMTEGFSRMNLKRRKHATNNNI
jgi:hypothetical protein|tara:strand:+ start:277 stop:465 length:189 start_codon:yes stop_codon:yes gene_type:complete